MNVQNIVIRAGKQIKIRCIILRNPHLSKVLYIGDPQLIPTQLRDKTVNAFLYDEARERLILRISS